MLKERMRSFPDRTVQFGPPDRPSNFLKRGRQETYYSDSEEDLPTDVCKKQALTSLATLIPNQHPEVLRKNV